MMSLFSSFDMILFFNSYIIIFLVMLFLLCNNFKLSMNNSFFIIFSQSIMSKFFYSLKPQSFNKMSSLLILSLMISIFLINFFSVFSFNFPLSSQFGSIMSVGLTFWLSFMIFSIYSNKKGFLLHFIPEGTPIFLTVFLFLIELVSNVIRPVTLTVRLVANILAGHLLMILLSKLVFMSKFMFFGYILLNFIELLVGLIQAYIFSTMITLYFSEVH